MQICFVSLPLQAAILHSTIVCDSAVYFKESLYRKTSFHYSLSRANFKVRFDLKRFPFFYATNKVRRFHIFSQLCFNSIRIVIYTAQQRKFKLMYNILNFHVQEYRAHSVVSLDVCGIEEAIKIDRVC